MEFAQLKPGRGFMPVHSAMYYGQRLVTSQRARRLTVSLLTGLVNRRQGSTGFRTLQPQQGILLADLERDGYVPLPPLFDDHQIAEIRSFLHDKPLTTRQASGQRTFIFGERPDSVDIGDYQLADIVAAPHILELANHPFLLGLAENYIGCKPTLSALVLRWSFPSERHGYGVQAFHRDADDWRHLKIFIYLTDVDEGAGPHVYVKGSQKEAATVRLHEYSDACIAEKYAPQNVVTVTGPAGFSFAGDTAGTHKGTKPREEPRLMLQMQYSLLPSYIYRYRPIAYSGSLELDPYVNRLMISPADRGA